MTTTPLRFAVALLCAASLAIGIPALALSQNAPIMGSITGKVFDTDSRTPLSNVTVRAYAITNNQSLGGSITDGHGSFFVPDAPAAIYGFTLEHQGVEYPVTERLDARAGMTFLLESCFRVDRSAKTASVILGNCSSELLAHAQVVTIGPHRFLTQQSPIGKPLSPFPESPQTNGPDTPSIGEKELEGAGQAGQAEPQSANDALDPTSPDLAEPHVPEMAEADPNGPTIEHSELECLSHDQFPLVDSKIIPGANVEVSRVYFRSDKYPDFYYVEAAGLGLETPDDFRAILPKPSPETERIIYYVEAVDRSYNTAQTAEHDPPINDEACERDPAAYYDGNPEIAVGATTAGAAAVPPGFQALGITSFISAAGVTTAVTAAAAAGGAAAGAGLTTGLVIVVSGAAVATGGAVVVTTTGDDEASPPE
jgi:hypothetical protein